MIILNRLYEKHNYLNKDISFLCNTRINEYDMKAGGYSILKRAGALTSKEIDYLEHCPKLERNIYLGNKVRENRELNELQMNGFIEARKMFFELNQIDDNSVLSIKKDAIFLIRQNVYNLQFDGFTFNLANTYNSYYYFPNVQGDAIEMYYKSKDNTVDIKGLGKDNIPLHQDYFIKDLCTIFRLAELGNRDTLIKHIKRYRSKYLNRELNPNCYREMNLMSLFHTIHTFGGMDVLTEVCDDIDELNIVYNYKNFILPLIKYYL